MKIAPNPFPAFPVAALHERDEPDRGLTVVTPGILAAEELTAAYLRPFELGEPPHGRNVAVRGEFGTGKTFLLRYAESSLRSAARRSGLAPGLVSVTAMEAAPAEWYRAAIGPRLAALDLDELATCVHAEAAKAVAGGSMLTASAVSHLEENPASARGLVQRDLLNSTSVEMELADVLDRIAPGAGGEVRRALEGLMAGSRPAARWLEGEELSDREAIASGLPRVLSSHRCAADALAAVAAMHAFLSRPFMLCVDELEHLVRFDEGAGRSSNVTWFKRLLERLASWSALVFVAGRASAWDGHPDFEDRFSPGAALTLTAVSAEQVTEIVAQLAGGDTEFGPDDARLVAECAGGSIRQVLGVLHALFARSEGFSRPLSDGEVREASAERSATVDPEHAAERLAASLGELGLWVARRTAVGGISFDLVASGPDGPVVVVEVKHALFGRKQQEQAQRFIDKLRVVNRDSPHCVGVFVSAGGLDPGLLSVDSSEGRVFWFDLTDADFPEAVRRTLEPVLRAALARQGEDANPLARDAALAALIEEIEALKLDQRDAYEGLKRGTDAESGAAAGLEFRPPAVEDVRDTRRTVFESLTRRPPLTRRLGLVSGPSLFAAVLLLVLGIGSITLAATISTAISATETAYGLNRAIFYLAGAFAVVGGLYLVFRQFVMLDRFYTLKTELLRDVYVLDLPLSDLIETNRLIEDVLVRRGSGYALLEVPDALKDAGLASGARRDREDRRG